MRQLRLVLSIALTCLISCTPKIANDKSIGEVEAKTYKYLADSLLNQMKAQFGGTMYESEKITPIELNGIVKIGIPDGTNYSFFKDNSKFIKGDLNNDKKIDLVIWANMTEGKGLETKKYFVFLQGDKGYYFFTEFKGDDLVFDYCRQNNDLKVGLFKLDSISGGLLIGSSNYQAANESYYLNYSYRCATEKYTIDSKTKELKLISRSDLLKKNDKTGEFEKVEKK
jgi:hypothetical protein